MILHGKYARVASAQTVTIAFPMWIQRTVVMGRHLSVILTLSDAVPQMFNQVTTVTAVWNAPTMAMTNQSRTLVPPSESRSSVVAKAVLPRPMAM